MREGDEDTRGMKGLTWGNDGKVLECGRYIGNMERKIFSPVFCYGIISKETLQQMLATVYYFRRWL